MRELIKRMVPKPLITLYKKARYVWIRALFNVFGLLPLDKRLVVLSNVWGFGDNTKYVALELLKRQEKNKIKLAFVANDIHDEDIPAEIKPLKTNSIRAVYALSRACVWVECNRKEAYVKKRRGQLYIQTWHGGVPLKKIEGDCEEYLGREYIERAKADSEMTDIYISNGDFCTNMYRRAFWYKGRIAECGTPRNDILINVSKERISKVRKKLNVPSDTQIALYAPTYRTDGETKHYIKDAESLRKVLENAFGTAYVLVIRLHPLCAAANRGLYAFNEHIIDGNSHRDLYELMEAADVLVTDYSNTMFEFAMTGRKVFLYTPDMDEYVAERGLYFEPNELPFEFAADMDKLCRNIEEFDYTKYVADTALFFEGLQIHESGNASAKTADYITDYIKAMNRKK